MRNHSSCVLCALTFVNGGLSAVVTSAPSILDLRLNMLLHDLKAVARSLHFVVVAPKLVILGSWRLLERVFMG
jgi:hypothetical protein